MESHLDGAEREQGNKRNGKVEKTLKRSSGEITIETPQDCQSTFSTEIVEKWETVLADNLESKIIGLYGLGMSLRDISAHVDEMYDVQISHATLSEITGRIVPKVKDSGKVASREVYYVLAIEKTDIRT